MRFSGYIRWPKKKKVTPQRKIMSQIVLGRESIRVYRSAYANEKLQVLHLQSYMF